MEKSMPNFLRDLKPIMSQVVKLFFFGLCLWSSAVLARSSLSYTPEHGVERAPDRFRPTSSSHYFIYEGDSIYMTQVEQSQKRLQKVAYENGKFSLQSGKFDLKIKLIFPVEEMTAITNKSYELFQASRKSAINPLDKVLIQEVDAPNCGLVRWFVIPNPKGVGAGDNEVVFPNKGVLFFQGQSMEHFQCDANGHIVAILYSCARGCQQYLVGIDTKRDKQENPGQTTLNPDNAKH